MMNYQENNLPVLSYESVQRTKEALKKNLKLPAISILSILILNCVIFSVCIIAMIWMIAPDQDVPVYEKIVFFILPFLMEAVAVFIVWLACRLYKYYSHYGDTVKYPLPQMPNTDTQMDQTTEHFIKNIRPSSIAWCVSYIIVSVFFLKLFSLGGDWQSILGAVILILIASPGISFLLCGIPVCIKALRSGSGIIVIPTGFTGLLVFLAIWYVLLIIADIKLLILLGKSLYYYYRVLSPYQKVKKQTKAKANGAI